MILPNYSKFFFDLFHKHISGKFSAENLKNKKKNQNIQKFTVLNIKPSYFPNILS